MDWLRPTPPGRSLPLCCDDQHIILNLEIPRRNSAPSAWMVYPFILMGTLAVESYRETFGHHMEESACKGTILAPLFAQQFTSSKKRLEIEREVALEAATGKGRNWWKSFPSTDRSAPIKIETTIQLMRNTVSSPRVRWSCINKKMAGDNSILSHKHCSSC